MQLQSSPGIELMYNQVVEYATTALQSELTVLNPHMMKARLYTGHLQAMLKMNLQIQCDTGRNTYLQVL